MRIMAELERCQEHQVNTSILKNTHYKMLISPDSVVLSTDQGLVYPTVGVFIAAHARSEHENAYRR